MSTFDTPTPITVQLDMVMGDVQIQASDRTDSVVEVRPTNPSKKADVSAAEQTLVEYAADRLLIKVPKSWRSYSFLSMGPSVDIVIALPSGSRVQADAQWASVGSDGPLGECRIATGGSVRLDRTGPLRVHVSHGDVAVEQVAGGAEVTTSSGQVRLGAVDGAATVKNSSGHCVIGEVTGELRVSTASGDISVARALADVTARTAYGAVRIGEVNRGAVTLQTSYGTVDVAVREGVAAWLDLNSGHGRVHNSLTPSDAPDPSDDTVEIRASTSYGEIAVRRAKPAKRLH
ncbi:MAG: DUF4097 family beta strand repeat-containing protein [Micromonosporaceae bacterium]